MSKKISLVISEPEDDYDLIVEKMHNEIAVIIANALVSEGIILGKTMILSAGEEDALITSDVVSITKPVQYKNKYFDRFDAGEDDKHPGVPAWIPKVKDSK